MPYVTVQPRVERDPLALTVCPECGYSLEGLPPEGTCPECGESYDQRYVVLFGETPEGMGRNASRAMLVVFAGIAAMIVFMSIREGSLMSRPVIMMTTYLFLYVVIWAARRASLKKEILFQVWMNERGFALRRPGSESTLLAKIEQAMPFLTPLLFLPPFGKNGAVSVAFIVGIVLTFVVLVGLHVLMNRPSKRRQVATGDPRQPTLTGWDGSDSVDVDVIRPGSVRLRVTSRSYLGPWKWQEWRAVDAVVRLDTQLAPALRDRMNGWIDARLASRFKDAAHA